MIMREEIFTGLIAYRMGWLYDGLVSAPIKMSLFLRAITIRRLA